MAAKRAPASGTCPREIESTLAEYFPKADLVVSKRHLTVPLP
jgi:hypothetical protein